MTLNEQSLNEILTSHTIPADSLKILSDIGSEQIYGMTVTGKEAIAQWHHLYDLLPDTGHYPVLIGSRTDTQLEAIALYQQWAEQEGNPSSASQIIEKGLTIDTTDWLTTRAQEFQEDWESEWEEEFSDNELAELAQVVSPDATQPSQDFTIPLDLLTRTPVDHLTLALVPTRIGWQVPAFLRFGAWNDCPPPEVHVALMKRWYELYGAEVVGITHDTVEMRVSRPPGDRDTALQLAQEQYTYCSDIVDQGVQTMDALASLLLNGSVWYFWWD